MTAKARLGRLLRGPSEPPRERPSGLIYALGERPPLLALLVLGSQHALMALRFLVYAVIAAQLINLPPPSLTGFVANCVLIMGVATLVQTFRSSLGSGHLLIHCPNPIVIGPYASVTTLFGIEATAAALIISGVVMVLLAGIIPKLKTIFTPEVTGIVVAMLGLTLIGPGVERVTALDAAGNIDTTTLLVATVTLATIVFASIWCPDRIKIFGLVLGTAAGFGADLLLGGGATLAAFSAAGSDALFAVPFWEFSPPQPRFVLMALIPILLVELMNAVDAMGGALTSDKMNDANWRRADMPMVGRALRTLGLSTVACGFAGVPTTTISSSNIGLTHATGVTSRAVGTASGLMLIGLAFFPPVLAVVANAPPPVVGAVILYTAGYMIASGMELILSRLLNDRRTIMIGLSMTAGSAVLLVPTLTAQAPDWSQSIVTSGLTVGTVTGIILNMIFRIGVKQSASLEVAETGASHQAWRFLQDQGAIWGARRAVMARAGSATGEAIEALRASGAVGRGLTLKVSFDEYLVTCELAYQGRPLVIEADDSPPDLHYLLEEEGDEGLGLALVRMSATIVRKLADRVRADGKGGRARLLLAFEH